MDSAHIWQSLPQGTFEDVFTPSEDPGDQAQAEEDNEDQAQAEGDIEDHNEDQAQAEAAGELEDQAQAEEATEDHQAPAEEDIVDLSAASLKMQLQVQEHQERDAEALQRMHKLNKGPALPVRKHIWSNFLQFF